MLESRLSQLRSRERIALWVLAVLTVSAVAVGIWSRVSILGIGSLWLDELWTLDAISRSFNEMIGARLVSDSKPPLWSILTWVWLRVVGTYDPWTMRLLPFWFSLAAVAAPLLGAFRLRTMRPAMLVLAALTALSLFTLQYAVELRSYSMMIAFGTATTVVWAGLLSGDLPRSPKWTFGFALFGALTGFSHYYGHLLYLGEFAILVLAWAPLRPGRALAILVFWGGLSLVPVFVWYVLTIPWFPTQAVAEAPSWTAVQTWLAYGFGPLSNVIANHAPGYAYPDGPLGIETVLIGLSTVSILGMAVRQLIRRRHSEPLSRAAIVGASALFVVITGVLGSWVASLVLPPSLSARNLAALLPVLFLAVAIASTPARSEHMNGWTGSAVVAIFLVATAMVIGKSGVAALAPPWQLQAGYRATAQSLLASTNDSQAPMLIGLKLPWDWHGEWDAALRAELGVAPAETGDPVPLDVSWILDVQELRSSGLPRSSLIVFTDADDQRSVELFAWLKEVRAGCQSDALGGPGFGAISLLRCPAAR